MSVEHIMRMYAGPIYEERDKRTGKWCVVAADRKYECRSERQAKILVEQYLLQALAARSWLKRHGYQIRKTGWGHWEVADPALSSRDAYELAMYLAEVMWGE